MSTVELVDVSKKYESSKGRRVDSWAVRDVNLRVEEGELITLVGPSGCGKTTTLRMVAGLETITSGEIRVGGKDISRTPVHRRGLGMMFQSYALFPHMSVQDNIAYGLQVQKLPKEQMSERISQVLDLMHLTAMRDSLPSQLSGGQQQRVALARAVVTEPSVLLFDEPLSNLDAKLREYMREELRALQQRVGITSLYVTHDQVEAMTLSDRVMIMEGGYLRQVGSPREVYARPATRFVADFMGKASFVPTQVTEVRGGHAVAQLGGAKIAVSLPDDWDPAVRDAQLVLRPESFLVGAEETAIPAVVRQAAFLGSSVEYRLEVRNTSIVVSDHRHLENGIFEIGQQVHLTARPGAFSAVPRDESDTTGDKEPTS